MLFTQTTLIIGIGLLAAAVAAGLARRPNWAQGLALAAGTLGLEVVLRKVYGVAAFRPDPFALPLAFALLAAMAVVFWWQRHAGLVRLLALDDTLGVTTRFLMAVAIAVPAGLELAQIFAGELAHDLGQYANRVGSTHAVIVHILLLGGVILFSSHKWEKFGQEKQRLAVALKASETTYRAIVEAANEGILALDADSRVTLANVPAARIFGYLPAEIIGRPLPDLLDEPNRTYLKKKLERRREGIAEQYETVLTRRDGTPIWVRVSAAPLVDPQGGFQGTVAMLSDITNRKEHESELEAKTREVEDANRHKSEFLANMSHELRTPLNSVLGFSEMLLDGRPGPLTTVQSEFVQNINSSGSHLLDLINDLLDLNAVEAGRLEFRPEAFELRDLIPETVAMLAPLAERKSIVVTTEIADALGIVSADPVRLRQVVCNYLSNAIKFTPQGGEIYVRTLALGEDRFRLEVQDTGMGIAAEDLPKLFTLFEQLDKGKGKRHQGAGLGLALTKRIVSLQGGRVGVSSEIGNGSTFWAELPRLAGLPAGVGTDEVAKAVRAVRT